MKWSELQDYFASVPLDRLLEAFIWNDSFLNWGFQIRFFFIVDV